MGEHKIFNQRYRVK